MRDFLFISRKKKLEEGHLSHEPLTKITNSSHMESIIFFNMGSI